MKKAYQFLAPHVGHKSRLAQQWSLHKCTTSKMVCSSLTPSLFRSLVCSRRCSMAGRSQTTTTTTTGCRRRRRHETRRWLLRNGSVLMNKFTFSLLAAGPSIGGGKSLRGWWIVATADQLDTKHWFSGFTRLSRTPRMLDGLAGRRRKRCFKRQFAAHVCVQLPA